MKEALGREKLNFASLHVLDGDAIDNGLEMSN
jgi:hypothetical protein